MWCLVVVVLWHECVCGCGMVLEAQRRVHARCSYNALCVLKDSFARLNPADPKSGGTSSAPVAAQQNGRKMVVGKPNQPTATSPATATGSLTHWKIPNAVTRLVCCFCRFFGVKVWGLLLLLLLCGGYWMWSGVWL